MSDQVGISPKKYNYNIKHTRIEISIGGLLVDPITNSQNSYHKNCMAVSRENIITNEK